MTNLESNLPRLTRRGFLGGAAGLSFAVTFGASGLSLMSAADAKAKARDVGAWVRIAPDNSIVIITPAAEMGQGSMTSVPTALAEELDADWSKVSLEMAPADPSIYGYASWGGRKSMGIYGSFAVMRYFTPVRIAGAQVRRVLLINAAAKWGVDIGSLKTEPSVVVHPPSDRRLTYGEIAAFAKIPAKMPKIAMSDLKKRSDFRIIGHSVPRRDIPEKVDGSAQFSIDVQLPGMVYASTVHAPVQMAEPESWNDAEIKSLKGVIGLVKLKTGVAIVADTFEHVLEARDELNVTWVKGAKAEGFNSEAALETGYSKIAGVAGVKSTTINKKGDVDAAFGRAAKTFKANYRSDYGYHAQMEPLNGVARFNGTGDAVEVWAGTQAPGFARKLIAGALGFKISQVTLHQLYLGGGFGRRSSFDYAIEPALIARAIGRPVKMIWTREEDVGHAMFRPQTLQCVEASLDKSGNVEGWRHCVIGDGKRLITSGIKLDKYYGIPNQNIELRGASHGIRLRHWRAVAHPFSLFAIESLVDEMAAAEGMDPFAFRRQRLAMTAKAKRVFDTVEKMSDWSAKRPEGRALGLSVTERSNSLGAGVVEISLNRESGMIRVHKVWVAIDSGIVVQPEMARHNVESGIIFGVSGALKERATVTDGVVVQSNFHDYEVLRMSEAPEEYHVEFIDSGTKPTGIGEIGNPFVNAAIANAFHALTGKRLYHMPFTPERVLQALKA
jgi:isoquinoline 1-oxidoreductase subunit beta